MSNSQIKKCSKCGKEIDSLEPLCVQCSIELEEERIPDTTRVPSVENAKKKHHLKNIVLGLFLFSLVLLMINQTPKLITAFSPPKPIRDGSYHSDLKADKCIENLWIIARELQNEENSSNSLQCPVSGQPYKIIFDGDSWTAYCPNPELHSFSELRVSKEKPIPVVR